MRFYLFALATLVFATPATAQIPNETIRAYNEAVEAGDPSKIIPAADALAEAAIANPENEKAVILAYEAGAKMCELGACIEAVDAGRFVSQSPIADATEHPVAEDRALLEAFANWSRTPNRKNRQNLDAALELVGPLQPTNLSIHAYTARYQSDYAEGNRRRTAKSAGQAGDHLRPVSEQVPSAYVTAEFFAAVSNFNASQSASSQRDMTDLEGWLGQYQAKLGEDTPDWARKYYFTAYAWRLAMTAWFQSTGNRGISDAGIEAILANYQTDTAEPAGNANTEPVTGDGLPFCRGEMSQTPKLSYRTGQAEQGFFGVVIVHFDIEQGRIVNAHIEASVPEERFEEQALETISKWTWEVEDGQVPGGNCIMDRPDVVLPLVFALG